MVDSKFGFVRSVLVVAVMAVALAACQRATEREIRAAGWTSPQIVARGEIVYCYTTIADKDCYAAPLDGEHARLIRAHAPVAQ